MEGVAEFTYIKDTLGTGRFWFYSSEFQTQENNFYLVKDFGDVLAYAVVFCDSLREDFSMKKENRSSLEMYEEYQSQADENTDYYTHYGGDIYRKGDDTLVISMKMHASFVIWDLPPCQGFSIVSPFSCPVVPKNEFYPIAIIADIYQVRSLSKKEIKARGLEKYKNFSFPIGKCE